MPEGEPGPEPATGDCAADPLGSLPRSSAASLADAAADAPYLLVLSPGARRALTDTLPSPAAFAAWEFVSGPLLLDPTRVGARLRAPFEGMWRARRGEYRVRYRIDEPGRTVSVLDIDHRRDAYRA